MPKPEDLRGTPKELAVPVGLAVMELGCVMAGLWEWSVEVTGFSVRPPKEQGGDFLVTIRALDHEGGPVVAWHGAPELGAALTGVLNRLRNGTLKWRVDEWAKSR